MCDSEKPDDERPLPFDRTIAVFDRRIGSRLPIPLRIRQEPPGHAEGKTGFGDLRFHQRAVTHHRARGSDPPVHRLRLPGQDVSPRGVQGVQSDPRKDAGGTGRPAPAAPRRSGRVADPGARRVWEWRRTTSSELLARRAQDEGFSVRIVSGDKDFLQLVDDQVMLYATRPRDGCRRNPGRRRGPGEVRRPGGPSRSISWP